MWVHSVSSSIAPKACSDSFCALFSPWIPVILSRSYGRSCRRVCRSSALRRSHTRIAPSLPLLASERPSGLTLSDHTPPSCPLHVLKHSPVSTCHQRMVPSLPPLITISPVGFHATANTLP